MVGVADDGVRQVVRFCRSSDGVNIAYAVHGSGPPLVVDACWMSHLDFDWDSPIWRHYLVELGRIATVIRFDERGHGLSDRDVDDLGLERRVDDLAAVVDDAGLDRFAVLAMAQGGPVTLHYMARNPGRVTRLVCASTYAGGSGHVTEDDLALEEAFEALIRAGWDRKDPAFRRVFTSMMIPDATEEQMRWLDELHNKAVTAPTAYAARRARRDADASDLMARVDVPTLVLHSRDERMNDFEQARRLARGIPGARLVALESRNHILLEDEPAWPVFLREVTAFLAADRDAADPAGSPVTALLTERELDVLALAAEGRDNAAIADRMVLSPRTVERHLQNIYLKLGLTGTTARTAAVARFLTGR
ncbi:alpha/beta fold hydrolase [Nocardioides euryhalodurans]|uniref:Alpha/beta fold hydrolase n=1 Tax=Nocardioides euryhalodurans TaxID=2518370 RepID=A0A4P7GK63_9ACTN|nr:alpha/beta fold hydrolase [Nocardioides euryhalodurans]QBR92420.1 alpha/beta fold hydrolase [Nocardioides euryhalodurans]